MSHLNLGDNVQKKKIQRLISQEIYFLYGQRKRFYAKPNDRIDLQKQAISCKRTIDTLKKVKRYIAQAI